MNLCKSLNVHNICIKYDVTSMIKMLKSTQADFSNLSVVCANVLIIFNALMNVFFSFFPPNY